MKRKWVIPIQSKKKKKEVTKFWGKTGKYSKNMNKWKLWTKVGLRLPKVPFRKATQGKKKIRELVICMCTYSQYGDFVHSTASSAVRAL